MKVWEKFLDYLQSKYVTNILFNVQGDIPETEEQKYWYNKAIIHTTKEIYNFEQLCEIKYQSLIDCLSRNGIKVIYEEKTNRHIIIPTIDIYAKTPKIDCKL